MTSIRRLVECRRGLTAVEFAIVAPVFLALLFGTADVGRFYFTQQSLREVAALAARQAMVDTTVSGCTVPATRVGDRTPFLIAARLTLCVARSVTNGTTTLSVTASYPFVGVLPVFRISGDQVSESMTISYTDG